MKRYFVTPNNYSYYNKEFFCIMNMETKMSCAHQHSDITQALKCLLSFGRINRGFELVYRVKPCYHYMLTEYLDHNDSTWKKRLTKEQQSLPEERNITFLDMPYDVQKEIKSCYLKYRKRYNLDFPEELFDYSINKAKFYEIIDYLKESIKSQDINKMSKKSKKLHNGSTCVSFILDERNAISEEIYNKLDDYIKNGAIKNLVVINAPKYINNKDNK